MQKREGNPSTGCNPTGYSTGPSSCHLLAGSFENIWNPFKSLSHYCTKATEANNNDHSLSGDEKLQQVLTNEFKNQSEAYVLAAAEIYYGLAPKDVRKLAFRWQRHMDVIFLQPGMRQKWQVKTGSLDIFNDTRIYP
ncbi:Hypothetical predicted protein [Octopus vulgaris]|uniref:Uncharacterized protein n=1 Tax=Octopus vulgaris TaxID=6645 RepID=A0AA36B8H8_OCTVU|nr:Hypothetical predicted protein [Octopus vulgaris]